MTRHRIFFVAAAALILSATSYMSAAGPSEVADAVMKGDRAALKALLQRKADVNAPRVDGATALHWAVQRQRSGRRATDSASTREEDWRDDA